MTNIGPEPQDQKIKAEPASGELIAPTHPREGWEEQYAAMARAGDDALLDYATSTSQWDEREWTW